LCIRIVAVAAGIFYKNTPANARTIDDEDA
jgi:hypothetical protein